MEAAAIVAAAVVAVLGWYATYRLQVRAQRRQFVDEISNTARLELVASSRAYQHWLSEVSTTVQITKMRIELESAGLPHDWTSKLSDWRRAAYPARETSRWSPQLEEYAILFPYAQGVRSALQQRHIALLTSLRELEKDLVGSIIAPTKGIATRRDMVTSLESAWNNSNDLAALFQDLIIIFQNRTLGPILGRSLPLRDPPDRGVPRNTAGVGDELIITTGD